ncbi:MAG TPA: sensor histidine kinase [Streptosporangiaceae bacterium]|nr:sensor histidine kinase [Streptosporangiaceae bacterium]
MTNVGRVRPPLTARLRRSHWIALDCLAAVPAGLILAVIAYMADHRTWSLPELLLVVLLASLGAIPVAARRIRPLLAFCAILALYVVLAAMQPMDAAIIAFPAFPTAYVLYMVAVTYRRRVSASALAAALIVSTTLAFAGGTPGNTAVPIGLLLIVLWTFGSMARQRRAYANGLQRQAASQAVAEERLRIARELHDVVAHSMAVIAVQAGFGQYVIDNQPAQAREALGSIQATSRDALDEMRRMLSVLRQADGPAGPGGPETASGAPLRPADGLADLGRLITRVGHAGVHVDLRITGQPVGVPASVDLSAFRIIQESLTNVVKHAATPDCRVRLEYREQELSLEILDDGDATTPPGPGTGHGLIGMRERVLLCGGEFSAGPRPERGFRVAATLPLNPDPAVPGPADPSSVGTA